VHAGADRQYRRDATSNWSWSYGPDARQFTAGESANDNEAPRGQFLTITIRDTETVLPPYVTLTVTA
jgi:hypothetical protein